MQLDTHVEDAIAAGRAPGQNWAAPNSSWFVQKSMWIHEFFSFLVTKPTCLSLSSTNNTVCLSPGQWYKSKYLYNFSVLWCDVGVQSNEPNLCHVTQSRELPLGLWHLGQGQMVPMRKPCKGPLTNVGQSPPLHCLATLDGGGPKALPLLPALSWVPEQDDHPCRPSKASHDQPHLPFLYEDCQHTTCVHHAQCLCWHPSPSTFKAQITPKLSWEHTCQGWPANPDQQMNDYSGTHFCEG